MINYNFLQRKLHYLALGNNIIKKGLYEIEKMLFLKKLDISNNEHIFVSGLPRSGTTMLLNLIFSSGEYASLKYSNMPFIMSPNISNLIPKKNITKKERFHNDGVLFDLNSPEAFDEVFFSTFSNSDINNELYNYISLILISQNKKRYLSKNNLNYNRIDLIKSIFPKSKFLIPAREPLQQSLSLLNQHLHFLKLQKNNNFIRKYMNYLYHFEFGLDHKFWNKPKIYKDPNNLNYWLEQWVLFYEMIYDKYSTNNSCKFILYENLINQNKIDELLSFINIKIKKNFQFIFKDQINTDINFDIELYDKAQSIYSKFQKY